MKSNDLIKVKKILSNYLWEYDECFNDKAELKYIIALRKAEVLFIVESSHKNKKSLVGNKISFFEAERAHIIYCSSYPTFYSQYFKIFSDSILDNN